MTLLNNHNRTDMEKTEEAKRKYRLGITLTEEDEKALNAVPFAEPLTLRARRERNAQRRAQKTRP